MSAEKERAMDCDVAIIGAGPSGTLAAALLVKKSYKVIILEKETFPRFSIGESLLPQSMGLLEDAGLLDCANACMFQIKTGAVFRHGEQQCIFDFRDGFTPGWGTTFQVERARFDNALAEKVECEGVDIHYNTEVLKVDLALENCTLTVKDGPDITRQIRSRYCLDASGFGRVLARLLNLDLPSRFSVKQSVFTHVEGGAGHIEFDREKILIAVHKVHPDIWYWVIPLTGNRYSVGVVGEVHHFEAFGDNNQNAWRKYIEDDPYLKKLLENMQPVMAVRKIKGYASDIKSLHGDGFAILGNAGEFLDPIFSSGVTIALKSASLAVPLVDLALQGHEVDWQQEYAAKLQQGVNTFRAFVEHWYSGALHKVFFFGQKDVQVTRMICSILAGYAWDLNNPFVRNPERRLGALLKWCE